MKTSNPREWKMNTAHRVLQIWNHSACNCGCQVVAERFAYAMRCLEILESDRHDERNANILDAAALDDDDDNIEVETAQSIEARHAS